MKQCENDKCQDMGERETTGGRVDDGVRQTTESEDHKVGTQARRHKGGDGYTYSKEQKLK